MLSKLYNLLAIFSVATIVATGGFSGYLFATGRLSADQVSQFKAVLRGDSIQNQKSKIQNAPAATQPAPNDQTAKTKSEPPPVEDPRAALRRDQLQRALLDRAAADVTARQTLLNQTVQQMMTMQEDFDRSKKDWQAQQDKLVKKARDAGFEKELDYVTKLPPKLAKEHIMRAWAKEKSDVVRMFSAMDRSAGQKIMEQLKTPAELQMMHELLEQLRLQSPEQFAAVPRKKPGD